MKKLSTVFLFISLYLGAQIPQKVIICGVCKDVEKRLPSSIIIIEKIGALFADYQVVIYENNSSDATPYILQQWQKRNEKVMAISEEIALSILNQMIVNRKEDGGYFLPEAIAHARNRVLEVALSSQFDSFDYLIMMDLDFKLEPDYEGFIDTFQSNKEWDAVFAYGIDPAITFWDWYPLRDAATPLGSELLGNDWWYMPRKLTLAKNDDWYPVFSAFGGCAIYKKEALRGCSYSGLVTKELGMFYQKIIDTYPDHELIQSYLNNYKTTQKRSFIDGAYAALPDIIDKQVGIIIPDFCDDIVWRMSSFVYKYPSVCEHVTLHAQMALNGYDKFYINNRLIFRYGG